MPEFVAKMRWTKDFKLTHSRPRRVDVLDSSKGKSTSESVIAAFEKLGDICLPRFPSLCNPKDVLQPRGPFTVVGVPYPLRVYRFIAALCGFIIERAHLLVYTRTTSGDFKIWLQLRDPWEESIYPYSLTSSVWCNVLAHQTPLNSIVRQA